jgi:hypothetical protein
MTALTSVHLPVFVYYIGYGVLGLIVVGVITLIALKLRNRNLYK